VFGEKIWTSQDYHTVELAPSVGQILDKAGFSISSLQALAVALGPGSFTGLRVGLALAKGLSLARSLPIIGISTFDVLAAALPVKDIRWLWCSGLAVAAGSGLLPNQRQTWVSTGRTELWLVKAHRKIEQPTL
jgi:tRNA threonylcarbamoyl adenosine modification protein YeaZ